MDPLLPQPNNNNNTPRQHIYATYVSSSASLSNGGGDGGVQFVIATIVLILGLSILLLGIILVVIQQGRQHDYYHNHHNNPQQHLVPETMIIVGLLLLSIPAVLLCIIPALSPYHRNPPQLVPHHPQDSPSAIRHQSLPVYVIVRDDEYSCCDDSSDSYHSDSDGESDRSYDGLNTDNDDEYGDDDEMRAFYMKWRS